MIIAVSSVLQIFSEARVVKYAFYGIRAGVLALIVRALYGMFRQCPGHVVSYILMGIAFTAAVFTACCLSSRCAPWWDFSRPCDGKGTENDIP